MQTSDRNVPSLKLPNTENLQTQKLPEEADQALRTRLEQRRALLRALAVAAPLTVALSAPKPAWAAS